MTAWLTADDPTRDLVRHYWPMVDEVETEALAVLLSSARDQVEEFAPALEAGAEIPERYVLAQAYQARALWRSGRVGSGDQLGADGMAVTVYPLDWTVKALLRPQSGRPVIA